jgi:alkylation response protein AidB-like acyl-CoA dehydrogenase
LAAKYSYNPRDARFLLTEWLPLEDIFKYERYRDFRLDDIAGLLEQMNRMVANVVSPTNDDGEINHPHLVNGRVAGPPSWKEVYKYLQLQGWGTGNFDKNASGTMPEVVYAVLGEMICAASPAFIYYIALTTGAFKVIQTYASPYLQQKFLPGLMDGRFQGCMCITEPSAGTDVGDGLTRAYPTDDPGIYKIKGSKIFISAGDGDHAENFIYLTLARIAGAKPGTKGLSLFIVPRFWINDDGSIEPNDVETTGVENKFGIRGCPTVSLAYGDNDRCRGWLIGNPPDEQGNGEGMEQMFQMMNGKRLECGLTSAGVAANEYWNAAAYCRERIQGRPLTAPHGDRIAIIGHEDVKRMLMLNKATTEVIRSLVMKAYFYQDISDYDPDPERRKWAFARLECLFPICKAYTSDEAWTLLCESIQIYGGYGFTEDYPAARAVRDTKINSLYEGTNYIQSMDLITRKWPLHKGQAFAGLLQDIEEFIASHQQTNQEFTSEFAKLEKALRAYQELQGITLNYFRQGKIDLVATFARRILTVTGQLLGGHCLLEQAVIAQTHLYGIDKSHHDYNYYLGKTLSARFYINQILSNVWNTTELIREGDPTLLHCPEEIFSY